MEERVPLTSRVPRQHSGDKRTGGTLVDEGSLELLEHLIAIVLQGNTQYLETLLQNEEILEVLDMHDNKGFTALHIASERVDSECVRLLLEADANPNVMDRFSRTALHWVVSGGCHCHGCDSKRARCTELLVRAKGNLELKDVKGETPLSYAAKNGFHKVAAVMIDHGAEIGRTCNGVSAAELILQKIPEVMIHLLDQSVTYDYDDNSKLKVDFKILLPAPPVSKGKNIPSSDSPEVATGSRKKPSPQKELTLIQSFAKSSPPIRDELLTHPVTATFLHLKWNYIWKWFWFIRVLYTLMAVTYTYFVYSLYLAKCPMAETQDRSTCDTGIELWILGLCIAAWAGMMAISAFYGLVHSFKVTCTSGLNLAWWTLIGCVTLSILPIFGVLEYWNWMYYVAVVSVFVVWTMILRHLGQTPGFGDYVTMFTTVLCRTVIGIVTFAAVFFGFVFGFCILMQEPTFTNHFSNSTYFKNISTAFLRLFLMTLEGSGYAEILKGQESLPRTLDNWKAVGTDVYALTFIIFGLVLMNLLIALAVTGVQNVEKNRDFSKTMKKIHAIAHLESMLNDNWILNCIQNCFLGQISVYRRNGRYFRLAPADPQDNSVPPEIKAKYLPLVRTRDCLNKHELKPRAQVHGFTRSDPARGSSHSNQGSLRQGHQAAAVSADIDEILFELKQKLEGMQHRRRQFGPRAHVQPIFC